MPAVGTPAPPALFLRRSELVLRTRFTALKGYWQLLNRRARREGTAAGHDPVMRALGVEFERFEALLQQYLDASRLQWGPVLQPESFVDLTALAQQALDAVAQRAPTEALGQLELDVHGPIVGHWDARLLREAFIHLFTNAVLYTPPGGQVRIVIERQDQHARVRVEDTGIGIEDAERERIFEPFYRGQRARELAPGLGLGLFVASAVITHHGGLVKLHSTPDQGSVFTVQLPRQPDDGLHLSA